MARVQSFFGALLRRDASGRSWLPALLAGMPHARERLRDLVDEPGWLVTPLAVATANGELGAFTYSATPARELLSWYFEHPDALVWPAEARLSAATTRLRRALIEDDPPGARARAQERARELIRIRSPLSREWWRFEETARLDCVLITDRLVVTVRGHDQGPIPPATGWYPRRSQLIADLEASRLLSGERPWASVVISEQPLGVTDSGALSELIDDGAPHLDAASRDELRASFLGNITWSAAAAAVDLPLGAPT